MLFGLAVAVLVVGGGALASSEPAAGAPARVRRRAADATRAKTGTPTMGGVVFVDRAGGRARARAGAAAGPAGAAGRALRRGRCNRRRADGGSAARTAGCARARSCSRRRWSPSVFMRAIDDGFEPLSARRAVSRRRLRDARAALAVAAARSGRNHRDDSRGQPHRRPRRAGRGHHPAAAAGRRADCGVPAACPVAIDRGVGRRRRVRWASCPINRHPAQTVHGRHRFARARRAARGIRHPDRRDAVACSSSAACSSPKRCR